MNRISYRLFDVEDGSSVGAGSMLGNLKSLGKGAPILKSKGAINVTDNFSWTLSPKGSPVRDEVPTITLNEYRLIQSNMYSAIRYWERNIETALTDTFNGQNTNINPYAGLYPGEPTGFIYKLPFLSEHSKSINNSWTGSELELSLPFASGLPIAGHVFRLEGIESLAKLAAVGVGHEVPKVYSGGSLESITVSFVLLNTVSQVDVQQNWELCYLLAYQNLQNRRNAILIDPPVFYTVNIPGIKFSPASIVTDLTISSLGQSKLLKLDDDFNTNPDLAGLSKIIPEAYRINITFQDLIPQSRNFMEAMRDNENPVVVTENGKP